MKRLTDAQKRAVELLGQGEAILTYAGGMWCIRGVNKAIPKKTMLALERLGIVKIYKKQGYAFDLFARLVKEADHA